MAYDKATLAQHPAWCGRIDYGARILCDKCLKEAEARYPQGWRYYPGDTCRHGVYVGGVGIDWMCGACESGEEDG